MSGTRDDIGVIPLAISSVFQTIEEVSLLVLPSQTSIPCDRTNLVPALSRIRTGIICSGCRTSRWVRIQPGQCPSWHDPSDRPLCALFRKIYNESIRDLLVSHKKVVPESERPNIHVEKVSPPRSSALARSDPFSRACSFRHLGSGSSQTTSRGDRQESRRDPGTASERSE